MTPVDIQVLQRECMAYRIGNPSEPLADCAFKLRYTMKVPSLSTAEDGSRPSPCWFIVQDCEQRTSKWGKSFFWLKFSDDLSPLKRPYAYSDCELPAGSLCLGNGSKRGHFFKVSRARVVCA